jgi:hypothetical protein
MEKHRNKFTLVLLTSMTVMAAFTVFWSSNKTVNKVSETVSFAAEDTKESSTFISPNGKHSLTIENEKNGDLVNQKISIIDEVSKETTDLLATSSLSSNLVTVPFNTFSPDNKYLFLKKNDNGVNKYFVLLANGKNIIDNNKLLEIGELFSKKYPNLILSEVTGWAAPNLIVINATKEDGSDFASYWLDLNSHSFIRLSNKFN